MGSLKKDPALPRSRSFILPLPCCAATAIPLWVFFFQYKRRETFPSRRLCFHAGGARRAPRGSIARRGGCHCRGVPPSMGTGHSGVTHASPVGTVPPACFNLRAPQEFCPSGCLLCGGHAQSLPGSPALCSPLLVGFCFNFFSFF